MIRIRRESREYFYKLRKYNVILDGVKIGCISDGDIFEYTPNIGSHKLRLKVDWCGSNSLFFEINDDEIVEFICGGLKGRKMFLVYWYITFGFNKYLWIREYAVRKIL